MGYSVINTVGYPATEFMLEQSGNVVSLRPETSRIASQFKLWAGRSGKHYAHTVYGLIDCPQVPKCTYRLVKTDERGITEVLETGTLEDDAPTMNLAQLRRTGARLGATEVHIHFLASTREDRALAAADMAAEVTH